MKTSSWEIILTGLVFVFVAIYLINKEQTPSPSPSMSAVTDSARTAIKVLHKKQFDLKSLENLKELEKLQGLSALENANELQNLEKLKSLSAFLPKEVQKEFEAEIESAMADLSNEGIDLNINTEEGIITFSTTREKSNTDSGMWSVVSPGLYQYTKKFDATELLEGNIDLPYGSIELKGSDDDWAHITIMASGQISNENDLASKIHINSNIQKRSADFTLSPTQTMDGNHNIQLQATLSLPKKAEVHLKTAAGHILSEGMHGKQIYHTSGGHIKLSEMSGKINASTGGGHISVLKGNGTMNLHSEGGNIRCEKSQGMLIMDTEGGNLFATDFSGTLQATTNGGNIELRLLKLEGDNAISTGAGSIQIYTTPMLDAAIQFKGNSVDIHSAFSFEGSQEKGKANGVIGNGKATLTAETNYGSIALNPLN